jgi:hypothetical protein
MSHIGFALLQASLVILQKFGFFKKQTVEIFG